MILPTAEIPAKAKDKDGKEAVPEEVIEVLPGVIHRYPYHVMASEHQAYPDERLYLAAKRDFAMREFLSKAAMYAAVRYDRQPAGSKDAALAQAACIILVRFAQVYPAYAVHYDQPGEPKFFERADQPPPYRVGYRSAKWDWLGCYDVPLNLVIAYALLRNTPTLEEAGRILDAPNPKRLIEQRLFRASAEFVRDQPDEFQEASVYAYRGMLAVGRLLGDRQLLGEVAVRLGAFTERGFYHDGLWREGEGATHQRVMTVLDGWIGRLLAGSIQAPPIVGLARTAADAELLDPRRLPEVQQAAWPAILTRPLARQPHLLGGAGVARLAVGDGLNALDIEIKGLGSIASPHFNRLAIRVSLGGRPVLGDLDDRPPSWNGWERSTAAHNAVVVDGLNQREAAARAREACLGSDVLYFAADPDLQVACFEDRYAYPTSVSRYRHTVIAIAGPHSRYAVSVFEVEGGLQHDQIFQAADGVDADWRPNIQSARGPDTLLPASIAYLPTARAEDGRWFVQSYGAFTALQSGRVDRPAQAVLAPPGGPGVKLHIFTFGPFGLVTGQAPSAPSETGGMPDPDSSRAMLLLRHRSQDGSALNTTFVTLLEPMASKPVIVRAGRVAAPSDTVVLYVETADGPEHLLVNLKPGKVQSFQLADGGLLSTDGFVVHATARALHLAGGTIAELAGRRVRHEPVTGVIRHVVRRAAFGALGWFETEEPVASPEALVGRTLLIQHGDGTARGWTITGARNTAEAHCRIAVREEPGFLIDPKTGEAHYYQFPRLRAPGPHKFRVAKMTRSE
jgi:hypothetical protein